MYTHIHIHIISIIITTMFLVIIMIMQVLESQSYTSKGVPRQGVGSLVRSSCVSTLCPVVICLHLRTSERGLAKMRSLINIYIYIYIYIYVHICIIICIHVYIHTYT